MDSEQLQGIWDSIIPFISQYGLRVIGAILILIAGRIAAGLVGSGVRKAMERAGADKGLVGFVSALARAAVLVFAVIAALGKFGVETASFVAVIGAAGFAIGFAMQGSLSNFASGVMILVFRPFKVGDAIDAAGSVGSVKEIGIFTTTLATFDNKKIIIPNSQVMGGTITNINAFDTRRVDLTAGIAYNDDIGQAKQILEGLAARRGAFTGQTWIYQQAVRAAGSVVLNVAEGASLRARGGQEAALRDRARVLRGAGRVAGHCAGDPGQGPGAESEGGTNARQARAVS